MAAEAGVRQGAAAAPLAIGLIVSGCASGGASGAAVSPPSARIATSLMTSIYGG